MFKINNIHNMLTMPPVQTSGFPLYWKCPVFLAAAGSDKADTVSLGQLSALWRRQVQGCHDQAAQFILFLTGGARNHLVPEDFVPLIQDVVDTHPGLLFLGHHAPGLVEELAHLRRRLWHRRNSLCWACMHTQFISA